MKVGLDPFRNWCWAQWKPLVTCSAPGCELITRVASVPLLAVATLATEILIPIRWAFHWKYLSRADRLKREYEILVAQDEPLDPKHYQVAKDPRNFQQNRYSDILPNEPTRVKGDIYYNANWVLNRKAIACQGPLDMQVGLFLKMIGDNNITTIVSLANLVEQGRPKCADFWSYFEDSSEDLYTNGKEKIVRRTLKVGEKFYIQYHLENWPDHGVVSPKTLAMLVEIVSKSRGRILAHCSAGVGRTGTFLAALEAYRTRSWNIFRIAKHLRSPWTGRVQMIQQPEQYILIHDTIRELLS